MGMVINHNISALNTWNQLNKNTNSMNSSLEKLSSGYRINSAADDAAGLAISEKMRGQIRGLDQANENAQNGVSLVQTAEGALEETENILQRMRELAVQSASDTNTDDDRANIQDEIDALVDEINNIANTTEFNTKKLLDGSMGSAVAAAAANVQTNTSIAAGASTPADTTTVLTALTDNAGNSLGIDATDTITISYMKNGALQTTTITGSDTLADLATADYGLTVDSTTGAISATAAAAGTDGAIYGLTFTVTDANGDKNTKATNALSAFTQTTAAEDVRLDGSSTILIGANTGQDIKVSIGNMDAVNLGVEGLQADSQAAANIAIKVIDTATAMVSSTRAQLGAVQNRLESTSNNLSTASENLTAAESLIRDVDMASEMATYTKLSVITQAATAMLAQANQQPQQVLKLLQ
ncbi:MAG TPA: flagellin [Selenomonadales bacterium]|nr:flagellin [Selenomonadales bacterium]